MTEENIVLESCADCDNEGTDTVPEQPSEPNPPAPAPEPVPPPSDEQPPKEEEAKVRYYVVKSIEESFASKREAARFIEDQIDSGKDKDKYAVLRGKPCELTFEVKTKVVIK